MFKRSFLILCLLFCLNSLWATVKVDLPWISQETEAQRGVRLQRMQFEGCAYSEDGALPLFYRLLRLPGEGTVRISGIQSRNLTEVEAALVPPGAVPAEYAWTVSPRKGEGTHAVGLSLLPFRRTPAGKIEVITSFQWEYQAVSNMPTAARSQTVSKKSETRTISNSVFSQGRWVKLAVPQSGMYQLTYEQLKKWGFSNPAGVSVWGNPCKTLSTALSDTFPHDLRQIPVFISDNKRIVFYAQAVDTWRWDVGLSMLVYDRNEYDSQAYVYLSDTQAPLVAEDNQDTMPDDMNELESDSYTYTLCHERYDTCLIASGRRFFGESFDIYPSRNYSFAIPAVKKNVPATVKAVFAVRSGSTSQVQALANAGVLAQSSVSGVDLDSKVGDFARESVVKFNVPLSSESLQFTLAYQKPSGSVNAKAWLDYLVVNARASLQLPTSGQLCFRDLYSLQERAVTNFSVAQAAAGVQVFDVSDAFGMKKVSSELEGSVARFRVRTDRLRAFAVVLPQKLPQPTFVESIANQDLHGAEAMDYLMVTHPAFLEQAENLAQWHRSKSGLRVKVCTTEQVYNEFSGGIPDPTAIRNYMYFLKKKGAMPSYLLLLGDGSYVNMKGKPGASLVPTFQSMASLHLGSSYMTDDYFVCLEDGENLDASGGIPRNGLSTAVGRLTVSTRSQAERMVNKIKDYMSAPAGEWMNKWVFIADDEDANEHMSQADQLADSVRLNHPYFSVKKLYLDAFPQQSSPSGERYPLANVAINREFNQGHLVSCYVGHANAYWLADERVLTLTDIQSWTNGRKMPLFITATCEFARFDAPSGMSAGEYVLLQPNGGAVALLSTTRLVYSHLNFALTSSLCKKLTTPDVSGNYLRLGQALKEAKNENATGINQLCFSLLGDPALPLHMPASGLVLDSLNHKPIALFADTLKALSRVKMKGHSPEALNSDIWFSIYDKEKKISTLGNGGETPFQYFDRTARLVHARLDGSSGSFGAAFILPKDVLPAYGSGLMTYWSYPSASGIRSRAGNFDRFVLGGLDATQVGKDNNGPQIKLYLNDESFVPGGVSGTKPVLIAHLSDSSGINISGNGIGRNISLKILPSETEYAINEAYVSDKGNPNSGVVRYEMDKLEPGDYTLSLKAWDNYNNASEKSLPFRIAQNEKFALFHVLNYPNPFTERTAFFFEHNAADQSMQYLIQVFTISGRQVKTFRGMLSSAARVGPIEWDGRDDYGNRLARGVYFYKVKVSCIGGESAEKIEKLVILK